VALFRNGEPSDVVHNEHREQVNEKRSKSVNLVENKTIPKYFYRYCNRALREQKAHFDKAVIFWLKCQHNQDEHICIVAKV
jgi:hypothetical protein